jgi:hypothetical protein
VISVFEGASDAAARLGPGGVDGGGALGDTVRVAHLPAGLVGGEVWVEPDDPGHAAVSSGVRGTCRKRWRCWSRKGSEETRSHSSARREKYGV